MSLLEEGDQTIQMGWMNAFYSFRRDLAGQNVFRTACRESQWASLLCLGLYHNGMGGWVVG